MKLPTAFRRFRDMFVTQQERPVAHPVPLPAASGPDAPVARVVASVAEDARSRHLRQTLLGRTPEEIAIHQKIEALCSARSRDANGASANASVSSLMVEIEEHFHFDETCRDADLELGVSASLMAPAEPAKLAELAGPDSPVGQQLRQRGPAEASITVFDSHNIDARRLFTRLQDTHQEKSISGDGANCAWRSAWTAVLLKLPPEELERMILGALGSDYAIPAAQMRIAGESVKRNGILSIFNHDDLQQNSRLHLPGFTGEDGEVLLDDLACKLLQKGGATPGHAETLVYDEQFAGAEDLMQFFAPLGVSAAVLEIQRETTNSIASLNFDKATLTVCSRDAVRPPDAVSRDEDRETHCAEVQDLLRDMPVLVIHGGHFTVRIPNGDMAH